MTQSACERAVEAANPGVPVPTLKAGIPEEDLYEIADRLHHAAIASLTLGISPISLFQAWQDWA